MELARAMLRGGKNTALSPKLLMAHSEGSVLAWCCPVLSPEGVAGSLLEVTRGGCGAELSGAQEDTVVSSALQRPFGASDHKAGASLQGLGLVLALLGPPAALLCPYLVSF